MLIGKLGTPCLRGRTNFGDSIEDEWVIVFILRELTTRHKDIWARVVDSDGEFLLVEAAGTLPAWLEPEVADNRVISTLPTIASDFSWDLLMRSEQGLDSSRASTDHQAETRKGTQHYRKTHAL